MDEAAIHRALNASLIPTQDFAPAAWKNLRDPFPEWRRKAAA